MGVLGSLTMHLKRQLDKKITADKSVTAVPHLVAYVNSIMHRLGCMSSYLHAAKMNQLLFINTWL